MNKVKAMGEIIKAIISHEENNTRQPIYDPMEDTDYVGVVIEGYYAYAFMKKDFCIDPAKMATGSMVTHCFERDYYMSQIHFTGNIKKSDKRDLVELKSDKGELIYLDLKYLKKFGKPEDLTFKSEGHGKVVNVYEGVFYIGSIMPVRK